MTREERAALERALREADPPDAGPALERARKTVLTVHAESRPRRRIRRAAPLVWAVAATVLAAVFVTQRDSGPAQAVERLVRDIVQVAPDPTPAPAERLRLPAAGRLLVSGSEGLFVLARDGRRTRLGRYDDATWSPNGRFVAAAAGRTLSALDPSGGTVRWRIRAGEEVGLPRWSPRGLHVAYRAGDTLRIVEGDGDHDVLAGRSMAPVPPAWRPGGVPELAWAATDGTVTVENANTAKVLRTLRGGPVHHLAWSRDGRRLLIAGRRHGAIHDLSTGRREKLDLAPGEELLAATFAPVGNRLALAVLSDAGTEIRAHGGILPAAGRLDELTWSPDGRWLLAGSSSGGRWLLARASGRPRVASLTAERRFGADAHTHGWCC